jgi:hypothetical protein
MDTSITVSYTSGHSSRGALDRDRSLSVIIKKEANQSYLSALRVSLDSVKAQVNDFLTAIVEEDKAREVSKNSEQVADGVASEVHDSSITPKKLKSNP